MTPRVRKALVIAGYAAFYWFTLVIFVYLTFPYERLRDRLVSEFNAGQTGPDALELRLDELSSYWLSGVEAEGIKLVSRPSAAAAGAAQPAKPKVMTIEAAHARVGLFGLLFGDLDLTFGADAFGGTLSGATSESDGVRTLEVELEDLSLAEAPLLAEIVGLPVIATMNGEIDLVLPEGKGSKADGNLKLTLSELAVGDGKAKIRDTIALPKIEAGDLTFEGDIASGLLKLTNFSANGPDLELAAEGTVRLREPLSASILALTLRFRFTPRYTGKNEMTRGLFGEPGSTVPGLFDLDPKNKRAKREDGFYGWRVSGTLSKPTFTPNAVGVARGVTPPAP